MHMTICVLCMWVCCLCILGKRRVGDVRAFVIVLNVCICIVVYTSSVYACDLHVSKLGTKFVHFLCVFTYYYINILNLHICLLYLCFMKFSVYYLSSFATLMLRERVVSSAHHVKNIVCKWHVIDVNKKQL